MVVWPEGAVIGYWLTRRCGVYALITAAAPALHSRPRLRGPRRQLQLARQPRACAPGPLRQAVPGAVRERWPSTSSRACTGASSALRTAPAWWHTARRRSVPLTTTLGPVAAFICYESVFPRAAPAGGAGAQVLVLGTNDAWFGWVTVRGSTSTWTHARHRTALAAACRQRRRDGRGRPVRRGGRDPRGVGGTLAVTFELREGTTLWCVTASGCPQYWPRGWWCALSSMRVRRRA